MKLDVIGQHRVCGVVVDHDDDVVLDAESLAELMAKSTEQGVHEGSMRRIQAADDLCSSARV